MSGRKLKKGGRPVASLLLTVLTTLCLMQPADTAHQAAIKKEAANLVCSLSSQMASVAAFAIHIMGRLTKSKTSLRTLLSDMEAANFQAEGTKDSLLAKLAKKTRHEIQTLDSAINTKTIEALKATAECTYDSGRLNEFLSVFFQTKTDTASQHCITGTGSSAAQPGDLTCFTGTKANRPISEPAETAPAPSAAWTAINRATSDLAASASKNCRFLSGGAAQTSLLATQTTDDIALEWGNGIIKAAIDGNAFKASDWLPKRAADPKQTEFKNCITALEAFTSGIQTADSEASKLLKLANSDDKGLEDITIAIGNYGSDEPKKEIVLKTTELKAAHAAIKSYRENKAEDDVSLLKKRQKYYETLLGINKTSCEHGTRVDEHVTADNANKDMTNNCSNKKGEACKDGCKEVEEGGKKKCVKDPDYKPKQVEGGERKSLLTAPTQKQKKNAKRMREKNRRKKCSLWLDLLCRRKRELHKHKCLDGCFPGKIKICSDGCCICEFRSILVF
uniref:Variant surface glycoprotein 1125.1723 n=1 Tax=Trypanosoma brucei TaxID=5691 RepID=A0A1J0R7L2_9TRYP|nr:variant surface glycoprotein 1125.1723 [Trypanosoma brucei]